MYNNNSSETPEARSQNPMANQEHEHDKDQNQARTQSQTWGTWEELLLASAVKRHGLKNWDLVASEIRTKTSLPLVLTTAQNCELKYHDLHHRFTATTALSSPRPQEEDKQVVVAAKEQPAPLLLLCNNTNNKDSDNQQQNPFCGDIPWLEELRKLRVAELKQEVHRYDVSILSLQLKVKRLEEEGEENLKGDVKKESSAADLIEKRSENQKKREEENGSVNESNSTGEEEEEEEEEEKEGMKLKEEAGEDSGGGGGCGGDSVTQESWASLSGQQRTRTINKKSEPLTVVLDMIRSHSHASFFQALSLSITHSQEVKLYQEMIRQHIDLEIIQTRVDQGSYSSNLGFYRDLLLLFNNVILFFPNTSLQSLAAHQLRSLVSDQLRNRTHNHTTPTPHPTSTSELEASDSLLPKPKNKSSVPILFSRKPSSVSAKPSDSSSTQNQQLMDQKPSSDLRPPVLEHGSLKAKPKDKPVTGARSSRRSKKTFTRPPATPPKGPHTTPATKVGTADKPEASRKKTETSSLDKKRSAADFLKRIKKNSPVETLKKRDMKKKKNRAGGGVVVDEVHKKGLKGKESGLRKNSDKQQVKEESSSSVRRNTGRPLKKGSSGRVVSAKRGRESSGGKEPADEGKKPRKRSNR